MDILAEKTGWTIRNLGQNGREIPTSALPFPADTDLLIVMLGTNDLLQGRSPEQATGRLERFLSGISLERSKLLLIAPPPVLLGEWVPSQQLIDNSRAFSGLCQALAERLDIRFADAGKWDICCLSCRWIRISWEIFWPPAQRSTRISCEKPGFGASRK